MTDMVNKPTNKRFQDLTGKRYGRLLVVDYAGRTTNRRFKWRCKCDCGNERLIQGSNLIGGNSNSCGCLREELRSTHNITHGQTGSATFKCWCAMIIRCTNNNKKYKRYSGRGIKVCQRWLDSFENFLKDMGERPSPDYSIDRIDNDGNYEPSNCRWATHKQQSRNTSKNVTLAYDGKTMTMAEWAEKIGMVYRTLASRKERGWSDEKIITTPVRARGRDI